MKSLLWVGAVSLGLYWMGHFFIHTYRNLRLLTRPGKAILSNVFSLNNEALYIPLVFIGTYLIILLIYYGYGSTQRKYSILSFDFKNTFYLLGIVLFVELMFFGNYYYDYTIDNSFYKHIEKKEPFFSFLKKMPETKEPFICLIDTSISTISPYTYISSMVEIP